VFEPPLPVTADCPRLRDSRFIACPPMVRRLLASIGVLVCAAAATALSQTAPPDRSPASPSAPGSASPAAAPTPAAEKELIANVVTSRGNFRFELHAADVPVTVTNFCYLAKNGFFDGSPAGKQARVYRSFGPSTDDFEPGYRLNREFTAKVHYDRAGRVGIWRAETKNKAIPTGWVITVKPQDTWNLDVPIFGTVLEGQAIINGMSESDVITRVEIIGDTSALFEKYASRIEEWRAALEAAGWTPGTGSPVRPSAVAEPPNTTIRKDAPPTPPPTGDTPPALRDAPPSREPAPKDVPPAPPGAPSNGA